MICQSCKQETEEGKFCTNCGAELNAEPAESAAATEPTVSEQNQPDKQVNQTPQPENQQTQQQEPNEYVEKAKELSADFGSFCLTLIKRPNDARNINEKSLIPGIITILIFALIISLDSYITLVRADTFESVSFFDTFLVPLFKYIVMFAAIAAITFAAAKVALQDIKVTDVIAKYGAYMMPFILLFIVSIIFNLIKLTQEPFHIVGIISLLGPVLIVPVLIITERAVKGLDLIYTIVVVSLINFTIYSYLSKSPVLSQIPDIPSIW